MASLNKVFLIGNLTRDPEIRQTPGGMSVGDLRLAVNRKYKSSNGDLKDETCFLNVTVWGRQAETSREYLSKGSPILVEGRLKYDEWEKEGQKHSRVSVVAERIQFLGSPRGRAVHGDAPGVEADSPLPPPPASDEGRPSGDDDDLPF